MRITPLVDIEVVSFLTHDLFEQLAEHLATGLPVLGRKAVPEVGLVRFWEGKGSLMMAGATRRHLHGELLSR
jgi:hypothetical protein